jgi:hypothetical protein
MSVRFLRRGASVLLLLLAGWVLLGCAAPVVPEVSPLPSVGSEPPVGVFVPSELELPPELPPEPVVQASVPAPSLGLCDEWSALAVDLGFDLGSLSRWGDILWRESRCLPDAFNRSDPNGGSYGLAQINGFWCRPSRYFPAGWLQAQGVLSSCDDLFDPVVNLAAAAAVFGYSVERNGCGWLPWSTRSTRWCM